MQGIGNLGIIEHTQLDLSKIATWCPVNLRITDSEFGKVWPNLRQILNISKEKNYGVKYDFSITREVIIKRKKANGLKGYNDQQLQTVIKANKEQWR